MVDLLTAPSFSRPISTIAQSFSKPVSATTSTAINARRRYFRCNLKENWELQKKFLAFRKMPYPHDGETLFSFMKEMILEWNLDKKLFSIIVDNATNNDVMIRKVKDWILYDLLVARDVDLLHVSNNQKSELESYLEEARFPRAETFNILDWWKTNSPRLPVLANIARDILAIPATTVASKAAFSE
ncbi:Zinc finger BED domain-containing protein RICESLEEPER 4 [Sesamum angolense]|uniref:Zinc finger BED domain-containing protein RICESLEEPER 4 n=1 Tax=Sesamum angolense TaxID=2727404 RepID=A0AAE2BTV9_9LAMI|nr:Zinc finger BED domain-containing protein RICESLEEPER 4 [Sesamum angolense]